MKKTLIYLLFLIISSSTKSFSQGCYYPASFTYSNNNGIVTFTNTSTMISSSYWDFGDGNSSNQNHPVHTYTNSGNYTVTLNLTYVWNMGVYGSFTCYSTTSGIISVNISNGYGCTDSIACNYDPTANIDDGSCFGYSGCTDTNYINYNPLATCDDGSCCNGEFLTLNMLDSYGDGWNGNTWSAISNTGGGTYGPFTLPVGFSGVENFCLPNGCYDIVCDYGNWQSEVSWTLVNENDIVLASGGAPYSSNLTIGTGVCIIYGCTDSTASNYNATATNDDGSCIYCPVYDLKQIAPGCPSNNNGILQVEIISGSVPSNISYTWTESIYIPPYGSQTNTLPFNGPIATGLSPNWHNVYIQDNSGCPSVQLWHNLGLGQSSSAGCTDTLALNFDSTAYCDNGSCIYLTICLEDSPTNLTTTSVIDNRATINWDDMNSSLCMVDQYRIRYRPIGSNTWFNKTPGQPLGSCNVACEKTDKLILNLLPSTTYEYQMRAWYCGGGISDWTLIKNFTTLSECPNISDLTVYSSSTTQATFIWDNSNGAYSFARIKARVDTNNSAWFNVGGTGVSYGTFTKNKNNLIPGTDYRAQARTWCDPNGGAYKSPAWTSLIYWTQPTSIRLSSDQSIDNLMIYPNPSRDVFNISFTSEEIQDLRVRVLNVVGEEIVVENLQQFVGEYVKQVDLNTYSKGIYFLEIETQQGVINRKLTLQ